MPASTPHYQLTKLFPGDSFALNNQQYTSGDRDTIDRVLFLGAQGHHHDGTPAVSNDPTSPAGLVLDQSAGFLPAGARVTYVYTYIDPSGGAETAPSPESFLDLPGTTTTPVGPGATANPDNTTGSLPPGGYFYELSAYSGVNTNETPVSPPAYVSLSATGSIDVLLPLLPSGADGFNVYRLGPAQATYSYLFSIDMTSPSPPTDWLDDGSNTIDPNRVAPSANTTQAQNNVTITLNDPPPSGWNWNLYRTLVTGQWANTLVAQISTTDGSGNIVVTYQDLGLATSIGSPPATGTAIGSPSKINLTDGAEVTGLLPQNMIEGGIGSTPLPATVTFVFTGTLAPTTGVSCWVCPWTAATIDTVVCSLGRGSTPTNQAVVVDVLKGTGAMPTYSSIYGGATPNPHPIVSVGQQVGAPAPPNTTSLAAGDTLSVDILQSGGGTSPTDHDLTISVQLSVVTQ